MAFKKPEVNKIKTDIKDLTIYLRSSKKWGKSSLFKSVILEKYGNPEKGLLIGVGAEMGYTLLDNLNYTHVETWQDLLDLKEWLIEKKGIEHNIEIIAFDVVDELFPIVEKEVIRLSVIENKKPCKSIKAAWGGFNAGVEMVVQMTKEYFLELKKAKFGIWCIAHTKFKNVKQKGDIDDGYMSLSSTLNSNYEAVFGDVFDCVLTGYIDREIEEEVVKNGDNEKKIRHATGETRKLYLRGNTFIDAGCRFADGAVPEYIVFDKPNMAKDFIEIMEEGMRLSMTNPVPKTEFQKIHDEEMVKEEIETKEYREEKKKAKEQPSPQEIEEQRQKLMKEIMVDFKTATEEQKAKSREILDGVKFVDADMKTVLKLKEIFA